MSLFAVNAAAQYDRVVMTPADIQAALPWAIPLFSEWATQQERIILGNGKPLDSEQRQIALAVGVVRPESVRLSLTRKIPSPPNPQLVALATAASLNFQTSDGMTFGYGIYIRIGFQSDRHLLAHELAHVGQYERLGGILPFMEVYCRELATFGYANAPLELDAIKRAEPFR